MIITIDGPVASGKTTLARALAHEFGYFYINSGFLYRALAYLLIHAGYTAHQLAHLAREQITKHVDLDKLVYLYKNNSEHVHYQNQDLTPHLKDVEIDSASSLIATNTVVRDIVLRIVRTLADHQSVVIDGRDAGSVIFPNAELKVFLTARPEIRAQRWLQVQRAFHHEPSLEQAIQEIQQRDERDRTRNTAPLRVPEHAMVVDSSDMPVARIVHMIKLNV